MQDSEETIHSAEINDTSYETQCWFHWKKTFFFEKKKSKWPTKKSSFSSSANSQYFFAKISWIGPLVSLKTILNCFALENSVFKTKHLKVS